MMGHNICFFYGEIWPILSGALVIFVSSISYLKVATHRGTWWPPFTSESELELKLYLQVTLRMSYP